MRRAFARSYASVVLPASLALFAGGCSRAPTELATDTRPSPSPAEQADGATSSASPSWPSVSLVWADPAAWTRHKPKTNARVAEYLVPHVDGDSDDAECTVITFGPTQGGTPEQNIDRWIAQFGDQTERPTKATRPARSGALEVHRVEVAGTYTPMRLPGESASEHKPGYRLVGAVVSAPSGLWFFKLTGPDGTVRAAAHDFDTMIHSAHPR